MATDFIFFNPLSSKNEVHKVASYKQGYGNNEHVATAWLLSVELWKPTSALFWVSDSVGLQPPTASDFNLRQHRTSDSIGPPTASDFNLRQRRTSTSDSIGPPTASDFNLRQHRTSTSDSIGPPTASDFNLRQHWTSDSVGCRSSISDSGGLLGLHLRQRRTGLQSPTASDFNLQQLAS